MPPPSRAVAAFNGENGPVTAAEAEPLAMAEPAAIATAIKAARYLFNIYGLHVELCFDDEHNLGSPSLSPTSLHHFAGELNGS